MGALRRSMLSTNRKILLGFLAVSLLLRLACLNLNAAEYTDGILQITAFDYGFTFWPPLYTLATKAVALLLGNLEQSAKLVSILSSAALMIPLFSMALDLAGRRAAIFALLFYMTNAIAWRWSIRVMSDSLFTVLFFWAATLCLRSAWQAAEDAPSDDKANRKPIRLFVAASFLAALAALTRYQGVLLLAFGLIPLRQIWQRRADRQQLRVSAPLVLAILPWIAVTAWMIGHSWRHGQQIAERTGPTPGQTLSIY
ncbi:glycosyltransferase family 39 protein, partial [Candidatus Sumerlaeota bacterium]|nr:glycosyltransferase family 39 protein [Candidatus Sumerlaeota bacterium]